METIFQEPAIDYSKQYSLEEFLRFTERTDCRYEFWNGKVLAMAGTTKAHAEITGNLNSLFKNKLKSKGYKSFQTSIFLRNKRENILFLPDVIATCHPDDISGSSRFVDNPSIIVEVLSESTELTDRTQKWQQYRQISSLRYYLLVSQKAVFVEMYGRPNAQSLFYYQCFEGHDAEIELKDPSIILSLEAIYDGVFEKEAQ